MASSNLPFAASDFRHSSIIYIYINIYICMYIYIYI